MFLCATTHSWAARRPYQPSYVTVGLGAFDFHRAHTNAAQGLIEFRWSIPPYCLNPLAGIMATNQGNFFTYAGFGFDIPIGKKIVIIPTFTPGYYHKGKGKDLGFNLEFKTALEVNYVLPNQARIGIQAYHISNASLGKKNPGEESLTINYSIPLKF